jgi:hypothetical protein
VAAEWHVSSSASASAKTVSYMVSWPPAAAQSFAESTVAALSQVLAQASVR